MSNNVSKHTLYSSKNLASKYAKVSKRLQSKQPTEPLSPATVKDKGETSQVLDFKTNSPQKKIQIGPATIIGYSKSTNKNAKSRVKKVKVAFGSSSVRQTRINYLPLSSRQNRDLPSSPVNITFNRSGSNTTEEKSVEKSRTKSRDMSKTKSREREKERDTERSVLRPKTAGNVSKSLNTARMRQVLYTRDM